MFEEPPVVAYRRCRNLRDLIGGNKLVNDKCPKPEAKHTIKKNEPCRIKEGSLCCKQMLDTNQFSSQVTGKSYKIYHHVNCKSSNIIYLMDCSKCHKQYVGKAHLTLYTPPQSIFQKKSLIAGWIKYFSKCNIIQSFYIECFHRKFRNSVLGVQKRVLLFDTM